MRRYRLRADIWLCLCVAFLIAWGTGKIADVVTENTYDRYVERHTVDAGDIGGAADDSVYQAQSVEDVLSHPTFTVVSPGIEYRNRGAGYYKSYYLYSLTLPSGEKVAAAITMDSVRTTEESIYSGLSILPVGKVVYEDLSQNQTFLNQIEFSEPLTRTDFYIDMRGIGGTMSMEAYQEPYRDVVQVITVLICFPLLHALGAKLGIFPYFFRFKKKQNVSEWD